MISFERTTRRSQLKKLNRGISKFKLDFGTENDTSEHTLPSAAAAHERTSSNRRIFENGANGSSRAQTTPRRTPEAAVEAEQRPERRTTSKVKRPTEKQATTRPAPLLRPWFLLRPELHGRNF